MTYFAMKSIILLLVCLLAFTNAFQLSRSVRAMSVLRARRSRQGEMDIAVPETPSYIIGQNIPEEVANNNAIYDMILVERMSSPERTSTGLFLPQVEGKDEKHLGVVLSVPQNYGLESENGVLLPIEVIAPYKVGDIVYIRDAWGIGPCHINVGPRMFSFHKVSQITGIIRKAGSSPAPVSASGGSSDKKSFYF